MAKKKRQSKLNKVLGKFNPRNIKGGVALFVLVFALSGGGYYAYKSMAAPGPNWGCTPLVNGIPTVTLRKGSTGNCVKNLQFRLGLGLANLNANPSACNGAKLSVDGIFGNITDCYVRQFQTICKTQVGTVDGIVGVKTWFSLYTADLLYRC